MHTTKHHKNRSKDRSKKISKNRSKNISNNRSKKTNKLTKNISKNRVKINNKFKLGAHVSIASGFPNAINLLNKINAKAGQIFAGSNRSASLKTKSHITPENIELTRNMINDANIFLVIHAIYLINFCKFDASRGGIKYAHENVLYDIELANKIDAKAVVIHTGFALNLSIDIALNNMISNIIHMLKIMDSNKNKYGDVKLLLETSAGSGSQVGYNLREFAYICTSILNSAELSKTAKGKFGICIDTAHIFVAGYDIRSIKGWHSYITEFDNLIGCKYIALIHLNDSRWTLGKRHDEHRGIFNGLLFGDNNNSHEAIKVLKNIKKLSIKWNIPVVLETHGAGNIDDLIPYQHEIELLHSI